MAKKTIGHRKDISVKGYQRVKFKDKNIGKISPFVINNNLVIKQKISHFILLSVSTAFLRVQPL